MTNIQWTDVTDNPIAAADGGWWCRKISAGCANCYAEKLNNNSFFTGNQRSYTGQPPELTLKREVIQKWARMRTSKKHFVGSMTDIFGEWVPMEWHLELLDAMAAAPKQTFQLLTKRPLQMAIAIDQWLRINKRSAIPSNIWCGASVENQKWADIRIPELLKIPCPIKFLSVEPILEGITLEVIPDPDWVDNQAWHPEQPMGTQNCLGKNKINWVIVGGESGGNARPCRCEWLISIVEQCRRADVPVFVKQLGRKPYGGCEEYAAGINSIKLRDKKGGDIEEFPDQLQIREFPR